MALLLLAAGCTFERRPRTRAGQDTAIVETPAPGASASSFLERFQEAREGGSAEELESLVRPGATVMLDGRAVTVREMEIPGEADGGTEPRVADSAFVDGAALFVVRYGTSVETILLTRDSAGWGIRLLHRVTGVEGDSGSP